MLEVEKNVPLPTSSTYQGKYPWKKLEVGDSFMVHCAPQDQAKKQAQLIGNAHHSLGKGSVRTSKVDGGVRVWRIA